MSKMVRCKAWSCNNRPETDKVKRHYFTFPSEKDDKSRLERWISNIGTNLMISQVKNPNSRVCSDHFHNDCFEENMMAKLLDYVPTKKKLKPGAVPTIFAHKTFDIINMDGTVVLTTRSIGLELKQQERERKEVSVETFTMHPLTLL